MSWRFSGREVDASERPACSRLEAINERRAAAKQAKLEAAQERKERDAARAEADRLQRERASRVVGAVGRTESGGVVRGTRGRRTECSFSRTVLATFRSSRCALANPMSGERVYLQACSLDQIPPPES